MYLHNLLIGERSERKQRGRNQGNEIKGKLSSIADREREVTNSFLGSLGRAQESGEQQREGPTR